MLIYTLYCRDERPNDWWLERGSPDTQHVEIGRATNLDDARSLLPPGLTLVATSLFYEPHVRQLHPARVTKEIWRS